MTEKHVSDLAIQQFLFDRENCDSLAIDHINHCAHCQVRSDIYRNEFAMISELPKPVFDFNLSQLVIDQIEAKRARPKPLLYLLYVLIFIAGTSGLTYWLFGKYLRPLLSGFAYLFIYLLLGALITFLGFQIFEIWRKYQQKIDALNLY